MFTKIIVYTQTDENPTNQSKQNLKPLLSCKYDACMQDTFARARTRQMHICTYTIHNCMQDTFNRAHARPSARR